MKLNELLDGVALAARHVQDVECSGICCDTREMTPGCLFVALPGYKTDGHRYIRQALERGGAAVLCQRPPEGEGPWLVTEDTRAALAIASANWFGHPARELTLLAVTGTNGKTTTTYLLKAMLEGCLHTKVGLIGTNQNLIGEESLPAHRTTPESYEVQELLREMADAGCTHVVMEASSHALVLHRLDGIPFRAGIFTNLTQDHLDFHGTMEAYRDAKGLLFRQCAAAVLNLDDEAGRYYAETVPVPTFTYSECRDEADLTAKNLRLFPQRAEFEAVTRDAISRVRLPIPGGFTIYNALGVLACGLVLGLPLGVLLVAGDKDGILPLPGWLMHILNIVINILRSVPFLILMICVFPLTRAIVGTTVGTKATIVPLVVAAFPFVARLVETSLRELDEGVVEAAQSMGATPFQIITKVMIPECLPGLISSMTTALTTILGYSAMSGVIGGGGLGKIALSYGYYRYQTGIIFFKSCNNLEKSAFSAPTVPYKNHKFSLFNIQINVIENIYFFSIYLKAFVYIFYGQFLSHIFTFLFPRVCTVLKSVR